MDFVCHRTRINLILLVERARSIRTYLSARSKQSLSTGRYTVLRHLLAQQPRSRCVLLCHGLSLSCADSRLPFSQLHNTQPLISIVSSYLRARLVRCSHPLAIWHLDLVCQNRVVSLPILNMTHLLPSLHPRAPGVKCPIPYLKTNYDLPPSVSIVM